MFEMTIIRNTIHIYKKSGYWPSGVLLHNIFIHVISMTKTGTEKRSLHNERQKLRP